MRGDTDPFELGDFTTPDDLSAEAAGTAEGPPPRVPDPDRFRPVSLASFACGPPPPIPWIVDGLVIRGRVTVLVAAMKTGKSLAALALGADLALVASGAKHGAEWLGQVIAESGPVLYLSGEGGQLLIHHRAHKMLTADEREAAHQLLIYADDPAPELANRADLADLGALIDKHGIKLVIIDPLGRFWSPAEEANPAETQTFFNKLGALARDHDVGVLVVDHDPKAVPKGTTGGRGSGKKGDCADILVNLKRGEDGEIHVSVLSRWGEPPPPRTLRIDGETLRLVEDHATTPDNAPDEWKRQDVNFRAFMRVLRDAGRFVDRTHLELAMPCSRRTIERNVARWIDMARGGVVSRSGHLIAGISREDHYALREVAERLS